MHGSVIQKYKNTKIDTLVRLFEINEEYDPFPNISLAGLKRQNHQGNYERKQNMQVTRKCSVA